MPKECGRVSIIDATGISEKLFGKNVPNTAVLGAFAKVSELVDKDLLFHEIEKAFGAKNKEAAI